MAWLVGWAFRSACFSLVVSTWSHSGHPFRNDHKRGGGHLPTRGLKLRAWVPDRLKNLSDVVATAADILA